MTFRLLGPGRRLTFTASVSGLKGGRAAVHCNGELVKATRIQPFDTVTLNLRNIGPGSCRVMLVNSNTSSQQFTFWIRLRLDER